MMPNIGSGIDCTHFFITAFNEEEQEEEEVSVYELGPGKNKFRLRNT